MLPTHHEHSPHTLYRFLYHIIPPTFIYTAVYILHTQNTAIYTALFFYTLIYSDKVYLYL